VARGLQKVRRAPLAAFGVGLAASVLPDVDIVWFYLVDGRQHPHHDYLFHAPLFWAAVCAVWWVGGRWLGYARAGLYAGFAFAGLWLHMALDSFAAEIRWLWPFSDTRFEITRVPDQGYDWWVWNFVLHWTFAVELAICAAALALLIREFRQGD